MTVDHDKARAGASAQRVADALRGRITHGDLLPGTPLREVALATGMGVARTTVREAFRLLASDGLLDFAPYRGAVVRTLTVAQVRDIYVTRRILEVHAARESVMAEEADLEALGAPLDRSRTAIDAGDWAEVGTNSLEFHRSIVGLLRSPMIDTFYRNVIAQLRLAFAHAGDNESFQRPWVEWDRKILVLLRSGRREEAAEELREHLDRSERAVLDHMRLNAPAATR